MNELITLLPLISVGLALIACLLAVQAARRAAEESRHYYEAAVSRAQQLANEADLLLSSAMKVAKRNHSDLSARVSEVRELVERQKHAVPLGFTRISPVDTGASAANAPSEGLKELFEEAEEAVLSRQRSLYDEKLTWSEFVERQKASREASEGE